MKAVFCFFGKRKSGKDHVAILLKQELDKHGQTFIRRISDPLKEEYAKMKNLNAEELKTSGPKKEIVRKEMVCYGEEIRNLDKYYFCRKTTETIPLKTDFLIISDCRRPTDLEYFKSEYENVIVVKIVASLEIRQKRGFIFEKEIDEAETECALDDYESVDFILENNFTESDEDGEKLNLVIGKFVENVLNDKNLW
uniref:Phosphomevalonate kinase n=1 Tax=Panagrolaimus sp. JU765 TaxID=591449 RepID=A0AC34RB01_9BILA